MEFLIDKKPPIIINANSISKKVYFILSGQVHIMDCKGHYNYGTLGVGSLFGEISLMTNEPNEFGYFYNPYDKTVCLLAIEG